MVNLRPSAAETLSAGAPTEGVLTIQSAKVIPFEYPPSPNNPSNGPVCAVSIEVVDNDNQVYEQNISVAALTKFVPSQDGLKIEAVDPQKSIVDKRSNWAKWATALVNAGFPESEIPEDGTVAFLVGIQYDAAADTRGNNQTSIPGKYLGRGAVGAGQSAPATTPAQAQTEAAPATAGTPVDALMGVLNDLFANGTTSIERAELAGKCVAAGKAEASGVIFVSDTLVPALTAQGYSLTGEVIAKAA